MGDQKLQLSLLLSLTLQFSTAVLRTLVVLVAADVFLVWDPGEKAAIFSNSSYSQMRSRGTE